MRFLYGYVFIICLAVDSVWAEKAIDEYCHIECTVVSSNRGNALRSYPFIPGPETAVKVLKNQVTSTNWCGYVAANNFSKPAKNSVSAVYGSWIVPLIMSSEDEGYSAFWVGIDGYNSPTVEQIGTSHDCIDGIQENYAWFEMYPGPSYGINGFPLVPGDVISASVAYKGSSIFVMTLYNNTQKTYTTIPTSYTKSKTALRQCAEWIIEAPYLNGTLPLSNFVTAYMWGCIATINGAMGPINANPWQCAPIQMVTAQGGLKASVSTLLHDNGSFFAQWKHQ